MVRVVFTGIDVNAFPARRALVLATFLAILLAAVCVLHSERISDAYRALLPPLAAKCNRAAPAWFEEVGRWARHHDLAGLQVHLRTRDSTYDCSFGTIFDEAGSTKPMEVTTRLPYASVTKVFTSALAARQLQSGVMNPDQSVYELLDPNRTKLTNPGAWKDITLEMLLKHRAGFDRARSGDPMLRPNPPCPDNWDRLRHVQLDFPPGTRYAYSNLGYCLAGVAIERATGRKLHELFRKELLEPLDLGIIQVNDIRDFDDLGISLRPGDRDDEELLRSIHWPSLAAVGSLAGTASDLGEFLHQLADDRSSLRGIGRQLMVPLSGCNETVWRSCNGLAFYSHRENGHARMFWRDGSLPGATAFAAVTEGGTVFVLLGVGRDPGHWMSAHDELGKMVYEHL